MPSLPTLPGLGPGQAPPTPSAGGSSLGDVPLPGGSPTSLDSLGSNLGSLGSGLSSLSSLLGLGGSLTSSLNTGVTGTNATNGKTSKSITDITPDGFVARIAYVLLGIVIIAGAIYTYVK